MDGLHQNHLEKGFKIQIPGPSLWKICLSRWGRAWESVFLNVAPAAADASQTWEPSAWSLCPLQSPGLPFQVGPCCVSLCAALPPGPPCTPTWARRSQQGIRSCWMGGKRLSKSNGKLARCLGPSPAPRNRSQFCRGRGTSQRGRLTPGWLDGPSAFSPGLPQAVRTHLGI